MHTSSKYCLSTFLGILLLSGCATQMPVSEGLVFTDEDGYGSSNRSGRLISLIDAGELTGGISYIFPFEGFVDAAREKYGSPQDSLDSAYLFALPVPSFSIAYDDRVAIGSTVPLLGFWNMDMTIRLFSQYYLTINKKILHKNFEVIFQRRLWFENNGGVSVGMFYRYDPMRFEFLFEEELFHMSWFGVRTLFQTPEFANTGNHFRGFLNVGYVPEFKTPLIGFGISVALRFDDSPAPRSPKPLF